MLSLANLALALALAAPSAAELSACQKAVERALADDWPTRKAAFEACSGLFADEGLRGSWLATLNVSPPDAARILASAVGETMVGLVPGPNGCQRTRSADLAICAADREAVRQLPPADAVAQWKTIFFRLLDVDLGAKAAAPLKQAFAAKWAVLFPPVPSAPGAEKSGPLKVTGAIDKAALSSALDAVAPELRKCPGAAAGRLALKFVVSASGAVLSATVLEPADEAKHACLKAGLKKAALPKPKGGGVAIVEWSPES